MGDIAAVVVGDIATVVETGIVEGLATVVEGDIAAIVVLLLLVVYY